ncbi:unnamed protein product [Brachionus calyciflorus]|uniref:Uncharacterized protein n=1 Tax=Brachionus calyciflorus TaxID=104777 RepID=A0A814GVQ9_9BILA|nr:unnamed protein product [Brachionus calyciflorus]
MKLISLVIFIFLLKNFAHGQKELVNNSNIFILNASKCLSMKRYMSVSEGITNTWQLDIKYFRDFTHLNNNCINLNQARIYKVRFYSEHKLILNNNLDLKFLQNNSFNKYLIISFSNLKGIDSLLDIFKQVSYQPTSISLYYSKLNFYLAEKKFDNCDNKLMDSNYYSKVFYNIDTIAIYGTCKYFKFTCPLVFKDKQFTEIYIGDLVDSFFYKNKLEFIDLNQNLNLSIKLLSLNVYRYNLDAKILNTLKNSEVLNLIGLLKQIDPYPLINNIDNINMLINNQLDFTFNNLFFFEKLNQYSTQKKLNIYLNSFYGYPDEIFVFIKLFVPIQI